MMDTDPEYEELPERLRSMSEAQLAAEERLAQEALTQQVLEHLNDSSHDDTAEGLAVELRLYEVQLALNLRVRDNTVRSQLAIERAKGGITPEAEDLVRSLARGTFAREIDRLRAQLRNCREKLHRVTS